MPGTVRAFVCLLLCLALPAGAESVGEPPLHELMADRARWPQAIEQLEAELAREPAAVEPRLALARVLSWSGRYEDALAHYDRLLDGRAGDPDLRRERASVLSWMGRTHEAGAVFESLLAANAEDVDAWVGLARSRRWSGWPGAAERAYREALALRPDPEIERELQDLLDGRNGAAASQLRYRSDSDDFTGWGAQLDGIYDLDLDTSLRARVGRSWLRVRGGPRETGESFGVAVDHRLAERWKTSLELGARFWSDARDHPTARGHLEWTPAPSTAVQLTAGYDSHSDDAASGAGLATDLRAARLRVGIWSRLLSDTEFYGHVLHGWLSDGNAWRSSYLSLTHRPFEALPTLVSLNNSVSSYADTEPGYYTPQVETSLGVRVEHPFALASWLTVRPGAGVGYGWTRETGSWSEGVGWEAGGAIEWTPASWRIVLDATARQSRRSVSYRTVFAGLRIVREF